MKKESTKLINSLIENSKEQLVFIKTLLEKTNLELNQKETAEKWSVLECVQHLNLYFDYYIPVIENSIKNNRSKSISVFKSGIIGAFFVNSMQPKDKLNKMKTALDKNPNGSNLDTLVIHNFIRNQEVFIELLEKSNQVNLSKTKTPISISKIIKIRLGDTFRFINAHSNRHIEQIKGLE